MGRPVDEQRLRAAAEWAGWPLQDEQVGVLLELAAWLRGEAVAAGGIGPNEGERVVERHVADALLFAVGWRQVYPPSLVVDLGSGVGLPGIPLAVLWPDTEVILVDRSQRRTTLARRAIRVVGLSNASARVGEAARVHISEVDVVVARAITDPAQVYRWVEQGMPSAQVVVVGGSHREAPEPVVTGEEVVAVPPEVLDRPVWLRIMARP
jgi:16S rRNA G527 N7-methylase RsmG